MTAFIAAPMPAQARTGVGGALDRRQSELHDAIAARRQDAFEAEPQCGRVADSASSTALRVNTAASPARNAAGEQRSSSCCSSRPGGRRDSRLALLEEPPPHPPRPSRCKPISHRHLLGFNSARPVGVAIDRRCYLSHFIFASVATSWVFFETPGETHRMMELEAAHP